MSPFDSFNNACRPSSVSLTLSSDGISIRMLAGKNPRVQVNSPLRLNDTIQPPLHLLYRQRRKPETRTPTLDSRNDLVHVVTNDAKPDVLRILLDDATESRLCGSCHHIGLVQDDELVPFREQCAGLGEVLNLFTHYLDTAVVRRVELAGWETVS